MAADFPPLWSTLGRVLGGRTSLLALPADQQSALVDLAREQGVAAYLHWLVRTGEPAQGGLPPPLAAALLAARSGHAVVAEAQARALARLEAAARAEALPLLWLKGAALARTVYPRPELRGMSDLDVLVRAHDFEAVDRTVRALGFRPLRLEAELFAADDPITLRLTGHCHYVDGDVHVEVHQRLLGKASHLLAPDHLDWFWSEACTVGDGATVLRPEALLLHVAAHAVLQHVDQGPCLRPYLDLHLLCTNGRLDWSRLVRGAARLRLTSIAARALADTRRLLGTDLPEEFLPELEGARAPEEDPAALLAPDGSRVAGSYVADTLRYLEWSDLPRFVLRSVFPPRRYLRRYLEVPDAEPLWPSYLRRWRHQAAELARWTLLRARRALGLTTR